MLHLIRTTNFVWSRAVINAFMALLDDGVGAAGPLDGAIAAFYVDDVDPTEDIALAGFGTLAALGAAAIPVVLSNPVNLPGDRVGIKAQIEVIAGAGPTAEDIAGVILTNAGGTVYLGGYRFPEVAPIALAGDGVSVDIVAGIPFAWDSGFAV